MKEGLLEDIQSKGHWRVNIRPAEDLAEKLSFAECRQLVSDANVELGRWDYPDVLYLNDACSGYANDSGFFENWTDSHTHVEFWRMYQSGQFLHYRAFWEDREEFKNAPKGPYLSVVGVVYFITEVIEFAARLRAHPAFGKGSSISLTANKTKGREIWVGPGRLSFFERKATEAPSIEISAALPGLSSSTMPIDVSLAMIKEFFDYFGWNPADNQIRADQENLINRRF